MRLYRDRPSGTVTRARLLRREASEPERRLLHALRESFPGLKWRHQVPIGPFYADLLCLSERLIVEIDGDTHATTSTYDADRTAFIRSRGLTVIRFTNTDVTQNLDGVLASISFSLREKEGAHAQHGKDEGDQTQEKGTPA